MTERWVIIIIDGKSDGCAKAESASGIMYVNTKVRDKQKRCWMNPKRRECETVSFAAGQFLSPFPIVFSRRGRVLCDDSRSAQTLLRAHCACIYQRRRQYAG